MDPELQARALEAIRNQPKEAAPGPEHIVTDLGGLVEDGKNAKAIFCRLCGCKILNAGVGTLVEKELVVEAKNEPLSENKWWSVNGMMSFENIGFTRAVGDQKYITCADCERESLGVQKVADPQNLYLTTSRVMYK